MKISRRVEECKNCLLHLHYAHFNTHTVARSRRNINDWKLKNQKPTLYNSNEVNTFSNVNVTNTKSLLCAK